MDKMVVLENLIAAEEIKHAKYADDQEEIFGLISTKDLRDLFGIEQAASVKDAWAAFHQDQENGHDV